jgi:hypothetical protein
VVLEQDQRCGGVVGDLFDDVPGVLVGEDLCAVGGCLGALFTVDPETDQGADGAADLDRLIPGQVAEVGHLGLPVSVLVNREGVDHPDGAGVVKPLELVDDLTVKVGGYLKPTTIS